MAINNQILISIKTRRNVQLINPDEIICCILNCKKVDIVLISNECIKTMHNLKTISDKLQRFRFLRCHAKFLINLDHRLIIDFKNREIELINKQKVPISKGRKVFVNRIFKNNT